MFETGVAIDNLSKKLLKSPIVEKIASNPFYIAITIALIIVVISLLVFRNCGCEEKLLILAVRNAVYCFIGIVTLTFIQNTILLAEREQDKLNKSSEIVFGAAPEELISTTFTNNPFNL